LIKKNNKTKQKTKQQQQQQKTGQQNYTTCWPTDRLTEQASERASERIFLNPFVILLLTSHSVIKKNDRPLAYSLFYLDWLVFENWDIL